MKRSRVSGTEKHHRRDDVEVRARVRMELAAVQGNIIVGSRRSSCLPGDLWSNEPFHLFITQPLALYCASWAEIGNHKPSTNPILVDEAVRLWFAFALYCATRLTKSVGVLNTMESSASKEGLTLTRILRSCDLKCVFAYKDEVQFARMV